MLRFFYLSFLICISSIVFAQKRFDVFSVGSNYNFMQPTLVNPSNNYEASFLVNLNVPVVFKDSSVWITIADYQKYTINNEFLPTDSNPIKKFDVNGFLLRTGYVHKINSSQSLQFLFVPRVMTDFHASFSKSVQLGGIITYEKIKNKDLTWRIGLLYNQEFFGPYLTPVLYLDWTIIGKVKFTGLLPVYGKLYYQVSDKFTAGMHFIGLTTSYRINENGYNNYYVERNSIDLSLFTNCKLWMNIFLEARAGYSLSKDYGLYAENQKVDLALPLFNIGDNRTRANNEYKGSPFVHLRLVYSLPLK